MADQRGPWGKPKKPMGGGGSGGSGGGGGQDPRKGAPDLDALLRKHQDKMKGMFSPNDGNEQRVAALALLGIFLLWLASGIYFVRADELGVVLRFGKYHRTASPGPNYHFPVPFETVETPSVTSVNKIEIGGSNKESLMLTEDRNIVNIDFEVQWKIDAARPQDYLFNVRDPNTTVKAVAESAMREVIGQNKLDDILTISQSKIADDTQRLMQQILKNYNTGVEVIAVNLSRPDVPQPVIDEFQDVKRAEQDKATAVSVAEGYANDILPRAKGEAVKQVQEAEAYKNQIVAGAQGDVARFTSIYEQYRNARDVTKKRIYLETMEQVMKGMPKVIVDDSTNKQGVVPVLPLPTLQTPEAKQ